MLFNSYQFIAFFLPIALIGYYYAADNRQLRLGWLLLTSLCFYAYWDWRFLPLLLASIIINWLLSRRIGFNSPRLLVSFGIGFNLLLIGVFKYLDFLGSSLAYAADTAYTPIGLILPLGISFFTFQQISYLLDKSRNQAPDYSLLDYAVYVSFFPQLIAGPIVRHSEIIPQYHKSPRRPDIYHHIGAGLVLFALGLAKKTLIADELATTATPLFDLASAGQTLSLGEAWSGAFTYSLQLYYDFSGYSDMAIGLGLMFGLQFPVNFNAPYRATDIRDFWRRWHMTLSRFLRDYLYIAMGGNKHGQTRLLCALLVTMLLGGLWHGAGWTFVIWGGLHGLALVVHRGWSSKVTMPSWLGWIMLALFLAFTWVLFRAPDLTTAVAIWQSMLGLNGFDIQRLDSSTLNFCAAVFLLAIFGPTSQKLITYSLRPRRIYAVMTSLFIFYLTLNIANDGYTEFLYFQF
ncbi:MBOAT family protein [Halieaceae bacterium IMCC14734]|uniref:Probable alginate O-acetylase n=1 Tax=Candidatus Litorirhabdus singularis TaxID=2518993 RepID=A0ABT3TAY8_9GAMM|nr:MBOAT family O-acyltransferase [Candidatus Litorirhabdus singularis]MCX2979461.1 MBOAT family protein [Candidatus Litorirhabdus singularis]